MALLSTGQSTVISAVDRTFSHTIKLVRNDTLPQINLTLTDETSGDPIDLTTATQILLKFKQEGSDVVKANIPFYRVEPTTSGQIYLQWPDGVLDTAGIFTGEIEISYENDQIQTVFSELKFEVREDY